MSDDYQSDVKRKSITETKEILAELPPFLGMFFRGIEDVVTPRTRVNYARDLRMFFDFLKNSVPVFEGINFRNTDVSFLSRITADDIEEYLSHLSMHTRIYGKKQGREYEREFSSGASGKARKLSAINSMFNFYVKRRLIEKNPAAAVDMPKIREKVITRLEADEVARLLDETESGEKLTKGQKRMHESTRTRDVAILTLLLGTGMRVSECIGINIEHVDFSVNGVKVTRKGGKEAIIYFGEEVAEALNRYLDERETAETNPGHESALFISLKRNRISVRAVEEVVKKYSSLVTTLKKITPHKLRSTFGTALYQETRDIYLVASVLGHTNIETTRKHYAAMDDDAKRRAANAVKLRKD
jgi:site-specific recombinase XerD